MDRNELPVPSFAQNTSWYCFFGAAQMILAYHGDYCTQEKLVRLYKKMRFEDDCLLSMPDYLHIKQNKLKLPEEREVYQENVIPFFRSIGYTATRRERMTLDDLCESIDKGLPLLARTKHILSLHRKKFSTHYIVIKGYTSEYILINDPSNLERERISIPKFLKAWNVNHKDNPTKNLAVIVKPRR